MISIRTTLAAIAALALCAAGWWAVSLKLDHARLQAENASLTRSVTALRAQADQAALARRVEVARAERERARSGALSEKIESILTGDFPDAALDPDLADLLNRLREGQ
jgi:hypothetical protein